MDAKSGRESVHQGQFPEHVDRRGIDPDFLVRLADRRVLERAISRIALSPGECDLAPVNAAAGAQYEENAAISGGSAEEWNQHGGGLNWISSPWDHLTSGPAEGALDCKSGRDPPILTSRIRGTP
jgi:hypothetical protein